MRRFVLYAGSGVAAAIAAAVVWAWSGSRSTPLAAAPHAAPVALPRRAQLAPLASAPSLAEREPEGESPPDASGASAELASEEEHEAPAPAQPAPADGLRADTAVTGPRPELPDETAPPNDTALRDDTRQPPAQPARPQSREVPLTQLRLWSQPGMCAASADAISAREALGARFQHWDGGELGQFHVDPRLSLDALTPILGYIAEAEREIATRLRLRVPRPDTFLYFDKQLLTAAACISSEVAAYYDGALHVVAADPDLRASVWHEYTHHALISSGLLGPAWAQEGIAMNIARETWWRDRRWYSALLEHPFGIDDLDESIPYKLLPEQAVQFYAQSAALVACVLESKHWQLAALLEALRRRAGASGETMIYELPEVEHASFLRGCLERWNK